MDLESVQREEDRHRHDWAGDYNGEGCDKCARLRVMLCNNGKRVCEKCRWSPDEGEYIPEHL